MGATQQGSHPPAGLNHGQGTTFEHGPRVACAGSGSGDPGNENRTLALNPSFYAHLARDPKLPFAGRGSFPTSAAQALITRASAQLGTQDGSLNASCPHAQHSRRGAAKVVMKWRVFRESKLKPSCVRTTYSTCATRGRLLEGLSIFGEHPLVGRLQELKGFRV